MAVTDLIRECEKRGLTLVTDGERVGVNGKVDSAFLATLKVRKEEIKHYLWTAEHLREFIPGPLERQNFRRKVIEAAGMSWHMTPVPLREDVISRYILSLDAVGAALELRVYGY